MAVPGALSDAVSCEMRIHLQLPLEGIFQKRATPGSPSARWGERSRVMLWLLHWIPLRVPQALWMQPHHRISCIPGLLQVDRKQVASDKTTPPSLSTHSHCSAITSLESRKLFSFPLYPCSGPSAKETPNPSPPAS